MPEAVVGELSDQVWERILARDPAAARRCGRRVDALPRGGAGELAENVSFARAAAGAAALLLPAAGRAVPVASA